MSDLFAILPEAILYLACGFSFICGFYLLIERRFNFFSDVSFTIMLVIGFLNVNVIRVLPMPFVIKNSSIRYILIVIVGFAFGFCVAFLRNSLGEYVNNFVIKCGRRKTSSELFWYDILDRKDKPLWVRLVNMDKEYILEGVLLSLDESKNNPYLLLGYCTKYDLKGNIIDSQYSNRDNVQMIVKPDDFNEIVLIYDEHSSKRVYLNIE